MRYNKQATLKISIVTIQICLVCVCCFFLGRKSVTCGIMKDSDLSNITEETIPVETFQVQMQDPKVMISDKRRLRIDLTVDDNAQFTNIMPEQLGGNFDNKITYLDVRNVSIEINGAFYHLEDAIREGDISVEEIFAFARIDARNGFCEEKTHTHNGLTHFIYRYPLFDLRLTYDVYSTPDGMEHLINELYVCKNAYSLATTYYPLDREDWGLDFSVLGLTSNTITLACTQSDGQQLGNLVVEYYHIRDAETGNMISQKAGTTQADSGQPQTVISENSTSVITIDWSETYGELPEGSYIMRLKIADIFKPEQVHPLMQDFYDLQGYDIPFVIRPDK